MRLWAALGLAAAAVIGVRLAYVVIPGSGAFAKLETRLVDKCTRVDVAPGTEDVTIDPDLKVAFISAADRRGWYNGDGSEGVNPLNGVYALALDGSNAVRRVSPAMDDFLPHGISLWKGPDGTKRLFVVNHPSKGGEFIELFDVGADGTLDHIDTISFPDLRSPNDVVGVGPRQFYATNDVRFEGGPLGAIEAYLALPITDLVYFDGENGSVAAGGLAYANGVNRSPDGAAIYVAELLARRISVYDRDPETGALKLSRRIGVNTAPDNIEVSRDGALWIAGHSRIFDFIDHASNPEATAPSHVIRLNPRNRNASNVLVSVNGEINASSVGAVWDNTLVVGAVFDGHVMVCPMLQILLNGQPAKPAS